MKESTDKLKKDVRDNAPKTMMNADRDTVVDDVLGLYEDSLADLVGRSATVKRVFTDAVQNVMEAGDKMVKQLEAFQSDMDEFLQDCDGLHTGTDPQSHYLMDLCRTTGKRCLNDPDQKSVEHAGCCCAHLPLVDFGKIDIPRSTIPGSRSNRRMAEAARVESVCSAPGTSPLSARLRSAGSQLTNPMDIDNYYEKVIDAHYAEKDAKKEKACAVLDGTVTKGTFTKTSQNPLPTKDPSSLKAQEDENKSPADENESRAQQVGSHLAGFLLIILVEWSNAVGRA